MVLLILAGLYALIAGRITITKRLRLINRKARFYGALLVVLAIPYSIFTSFLLNFILPVSILTNDYARPVINLILGISVVIGLAIPFREKQS